MNPVETVTTSDAPPLPDNASSTVGDEVKSLGDTPGAEASPRPATGSTVPPPQAPPSIVPPPVPDEEGIDTHQKALQVNLDPTKYGTFAEIGAGQEVARWFFRVGGAAGTIAKSMSAYDMTVSDAIYGPCERYVTRHRLQDMLDREYALLHER